MRWTPNWVERMRKEEVRHTWFAWFPVSCGFTRVWLETVNRQKYEGEWSYSLKEDNNAIVRTAHT